MWLTKASIVPTPWLSYSLCPVMILWIAHAGNPSVLPSQRLRIWFQGNQLKIDLVRGSIELNIYLKLNKFDWYRTIIRASEEMKVKVAQSCLTLCDSRGYTVHGILQARLLERVPIPFSRESRSIIYKTRHSFSLRRLSKVTSSTITLNCLQYVPNVGYL